MTKDDYRKLKEEIESSGMSIRKDRIKMLRWVKTSMILLTYRLEKGKFSWLKGNDIRNITRTHWLFYHKVILKKNIKTFTSPFI